MAEEIILVLPYRVSAAGVCVCVYVLAGLKAKRPTEKVCVCVFRVRACSVHNERARAIQSISAHCRNAGISISLLRCLFYEFRSELSAYTHNTGGLCFAPTHTCSGRSGERATSADIPMTIIKNIKPVRSRPQAVHIFASQRRCAALAAFGREINAHRPDAKQILCLTTC